MDIKKKNESFNTYTITLSFGEMQAIYTALAKGHADPIADEMFMGLKYYMERLPGPGEDEPEKDEEGNEVGGNPATMDNIDGIDLDSVLPPADEMGGEEVDMGGEGEPLGEEPPGELGGEGEDLPGGEPEEEPLP